MSINFDNLSKIHSNLNEFPASELLIVTKNQSQEDLHELLKKGYKTFGENRVQEAKKKFEDIKTTNNIQLHLTSHMLWKVYKTVLNLRVNRYL